MDIEDLDGPVVLLVGAPASGKSTFAAGLVAAGTVAPEDVLSSDAIAAARAADGGARGGGNRDNVFAELRRQLRDRAASGRATVVDATHLWPRRRGQHLRIGRSNGRPVVAVVLTVGLDELLRRNESRPRPVPPGAVVLMSRQADALDPVTLYDEGFDLVMTVDETGGRAEVRAG